MKKIKENSLIISYNGATKEDQESFKNWLKKRIFREHLIESSKKMFVDKNLIEIELSNMETSLDDENITDEDIYKIGNRLKEIQFELSSYKKSKAEKGTKKKKLSSEPKKLEDVYAEIGMSEDRKTEIRDEINRRIKLWNDATGVKEIGSSFSFMSFEMYIGLFGYPFEPEEWMAGQNYDRFITDDEFHSFEYNYILRDVHMDFMSNLGTI